MNTNNKPRKLFNNCGLLCERVDVPMGSIVKVLGVENAQYPSLTKEQQPLLKPRTFIATARTPKISGELWDDVIKLFRHFAPTQTQTQTQPAKTVQSSSKPKDTEEDFNEPALEVAVSFAYRKDTKEWRALVSKQSVSEASVDGVRDVCLDLRSRKIDTFPPQGDEWLEAATAHSHGSMPAFFSSIDNDNEIGKPGYCIVVGKAGSSDHSYEAIACLMSSGKRYYCSLADIIDFSTSKQSHLGQRRQQQKDDCGELPPAYYTKSVSISSFPPDIVSAPLSDLEDPDSLKEFISLGTVKEDYLGFNSDDLSELVRNGEFAAEEVKNCVSLMTELFNNFKFEGGEQEAYDLLALSIIEDSLDKADCVDLMIGRGCQRVSKKNSKKVSEVEFLTAVGEADYLNMIEAYALYCLEEGEDKQQLLKLAAELNADDDGEQSIEIGHQTFRVGYIPEEDNDFSWRGDDIFLGEFQTQNFSNVGYATSSLERALKAFVDSLVDEGGIGDEKIFQLCQVAVEEVCKSKLRSDLEYASNLDDARNLYYGFQI